MYGISDEGKRNLENTKKYEMEDLMGADDIHFKSPDDDDIFNNNNSQSPQSKPENLDIPASEDLNDTFDNKKNLSFDDEEENSKNKNENQILGNFGSGKKKMGDEAFEIGSDSDGEEDGADRKSVV